MSFDEESVRRIVRMARNEGIDPAALLAVAEVESAGRPLEPDGVTPRFLFERHVFYRVLKRHNPAALPEAVRQGLAIRKRNRSMQYRDLGTHRGRMGVLTAARSIDEECANQACSWGLGQVLGENATSLGYDSATAMVNEMVEGGVPAQVEGMLRFVRKNRLKPYLKAKDWASFALRYNGPAYAANRYDTKMAAAYGQWAPRIDGLVVAPPTPEPRPDLDELPPPYEKPETPGSSKSVWTTWFGMIGSAIAGVWTWLGNLPLEEKVLTVGAFVVIICFFGFLLRERLKKIAESHV